MTKRGGGVISSLQRASQRASQRKTRFYDEHGNGYQTEYEQQSGESSGYENGFGFKDNREEQRREWPTGAGNSYGLAVYERPGSLASLWQSAKLLEKFRAEQQKAPLTGAARREALEVFELLLFLILQEMETL